MNLNDNNVKNIFEGNLYFKAEYIDCTHKKKLYITNRNNIFDNVQNNLYHKIFMNFNQDTKKLL